MALTRVLVALAALTTTSHAFSPRLLVTSTTTTTSSSSSLRRGVVKMAGLNSGDTVTILGPGQKTVQLIAAKVAADAGYKTNILIDSVEGLDQARVMSYGRVYARNMNDPADKPQFIVGGESLGAALAKSEGLVVCAENDSNDVISKAIKGCPNLKRVTLLSTNGGSKGGMSATESALKSAAAEAGSEWSIVRVGLVKGGGPGNVERGDSVGLDEYFYATNPEINQFQKDKFADQYLLGAKLRPGDSVSLNPLQMIYATQATSVAAEGSVNRNVAARALLQSLVQPGCVNADFSVDSTRGLAVPTQESWDAAFADCFGEAGEGVCAYKPEDLPAAIESPATSMRKAQQAEQEGKENTADGSTAVAEDRGFKLGASSREDELMRKQVIGHIIPVAVAVGLFIGGKPLIPEL